MGKFRKNAIFKSMEAFQTIHELMMHSMFYELTRDELSLNGSLEYSIAFIVNYF